MESLISEMLDGRIMLDEAVAEFEKLNIQQALIRHNQHLSNTAAAIGIHRNTISKRLAEYESDGKMKLKVKKVDQIKKSRTKQK